MIQTVRRMLTVISARRRRRIEKRLIFRDTFGRSILRDKTFSLFHYFCWVSTGLGQSSAKTRLCFVREQRNDERQRCLRPIAAKNRAAVANRRIAPGTGPMPGAHRCCSLSPDSTTHSTGTRELSHSLASVLKF